MLKKLGKYKRRNGLFFISAYLLFVLVGTLHYHNYDLNPFNCFETESGNSYSDIYTDFFSVCSLHQFSQTIDNSFFSSSDINQSLVELHSNINGNKTSEPNSEIYSVTSPRAPPVLS